MSGAKTPSWYPTAARSKAEGRVSVATKRDTVRSVTPRRRPFGPLCGFFACGIGCAKNGLEGSRRRHDHHLNRSDNPADPEARSA